jgi:hypothetical protein
MEWDWGEEVRSEGTIFINYRFRYICRKADVQFLFHVVNNIKSTTVFETDFGSQNGTGMEMEMEGGERGKCREEEGEDREGQGGGNFSRFLWPLSSSSKEHELRVQFPDPSCHRCLDRDSLFKQKCVSSFGLANAVKVKLSEMPMNVVSLPINVVSFHLPTHRIPNQPYIIVLMGLSSECQTPFKFTSSPPLPPYLKTTNRISFIAIKAIMLWGVLRRLMPCHGQPGWCRLDTWRTSFALSTSRMW